MNPLAWTRQEQALRADEPAVEFQSRIPSSSSTPQTVLACGILAIKKGFFVKQIFNELHLKLQERTRYESQTREMAAPNHGVAWGACWSKEHWQEVRKQLDEGLSFLALKSRADSRDSFHVQEQSGKQE